MNRCSSPTGPGTPPKRIPRCGIWPDYICMFGMIRSNKAKHTGSITVSEYLRLRQGLGPEQPLVFAFGGGGGVVRKESPSLLGPFAPQLGRPSFSCLPRLEGEHLHLPPRLRGRSASQSHRTMSPIPPSAGNSFGFPWPSSWSSIRSRSQHLRQESVRGVFG